MIRLLIILALLLQPSPDARLRAVWTTPNELVVWWVAPAGWHCAYLVGGGLPDASIGCSLYSDSIALSTGNVDQAYAPQLRTAVILRDSSGVIVATQPIPDRLFQGFVYLPIVRRASDLKPPVYRVILPIIRT